MMLFSVALYSLLVLCTAAPSESVGHPRTRRQTWTNCVVNGVTYRNGDYFTMTQTPCMGYRCIRGRYQVEIWRCSHQGFCHAMHSEIIIGCTVHRCQRVANRVEFVPARYQCRDEIGRCHPIFSQRQIGCSIQKCERRGNKIDFYTVNQECRDESGRCHPIFSQRQVGCSIQKCERRGNKIDFYTVKQECRDESGRCHPINSQRQVGCSIQKCERRGNKIDFYTVKQECRDKSGRCHAINSLRQIGCSIQKCERRGNKIDFYTVNQGAKMCQDVNGGCHSPGPDIFPYRFQDGRYHRSCSCVDRGAHVTVLCVD
ncbi:uncharacterized protein LOC121380230 isoform X2 [Gigantopelta aegis]|uniref:uncharacterized protein LOC121380230 isoform X2 n=1 Tax=Gigantopelta aegis TaxID=1735272 RepID=UPI001B887DAA|nr:uncharacterized protein LOC121380230 isoform X2 [Gigantopelta aegis]